MKVSSIFVTEEPVFLAPGSVALRPSWSKASPNASSISGIAAPVPRAARAAITRRHFSTGVANCKSSASDAEGTGGGLAFFFLGASDETDGSRATAEPRKFSLPPTEGTVCPIDGAIWLAPE